MSSKSIALRRPHDDRMIGGVCAAIGRRFGIEPRWIRVAAVASMLLPGPQVLLYLIAWMLIPGE